MASSKPALPPFRSSSSKATTRAETGLVTVACLWGLIWWVASGCGLLWDDAMISMRFAANLAAGQGWVFNPGEAPIEGFSNPAWVALMAVLHRVFDAGCQVARALQAATLIFVWIAAWGAARLARKLGTSASLSFLLVAAAQPMLAWCQAGSEAVALAAALPWLCLWRLEDKLLPLHLGFLALPWLRLDAALPLLIISLWRRRHAPGLIATLGIGLAFQELWRVETFGAWLPVPALLKLGGFPLTLRMGAGAWELAGFALQLGLIGLIVPLWLGWREGGSDRMLVSVISFQLAYSVWVGGDSGDGSALTNRWVLAIWPLLAVLGVKALSGRSRAWGILAAVLAITPPLGLRALPGGAVPDWVAANAQRSTTASELEARTDPRALIAVSAAGTVPYFIDRPVIDLLGRVDPVVARAEASMPFGPREKWIAYIPGHLKLDLAHSLGRLRPDLIVDVWSIELVDPGVWGYCHDEDTDWWIRRDSELIEEELQRRACSDNLSP